MKFFYLQYGEDRVFPGGSVAKNTTANSGNRFNLWVGKIPWRRKWQSTPVFLPGKSHWQRSLEGHSSWNHKKVRYHLVTKQQHGGGNLWPGIQDFSLLNTWLPFQPHSESHSPFHTHSSICHCCQVTHSSCKALSSFSSKLLICSYILPRQFLLTILNISPPLGSFPYWFPVWTCYLLESFIVLVCSIT